MKRGQIWWADLSEPRGSAPGCRRPVLIVQDDLLTESRLKTVMVVPLTTELRRAVAAGNVLLEPENSGLSKPSVALVCQVVTLDKGDLTDLVGSLSRRELSKIDSGLKLAFDLE